ncbi:unnamed protein product [Menidia menidia]|uniref:Protein FAM161A n=1 Tax=Menidia menidia TaxID=238744 RepID=A0A8S4BZL6_9TELE|nr:unnamed protein product [Menidia menidia]
MAAMYRSASLGNKELAAVYEAGGDEDSVGEECDVDSESSEEGKGGRGVRSSLSLEIYGLHREQQVFFSNQEYYRRLEELKSTHLRNVNKASCPKTPARASRVRGAMVTVPQPFRMTLREEERRRRRVRTRSEVELENSLLRRELEELRECRKQFRATPAPPHTRLPLYGRGGGGGGRRGSPQPFSFLERERRKKEAKMAAELGARGQREERQAFRARAAPGGPGAVARQRAARHQHPPQQHPARPPPLREATEGQSEQSSDPEQSDSSSNSSSSSHRAVRRQIELSIEMVKERKGPPLTRWGGHSLSACESCSPPWRLRKPPDPPHRTQLQTFHSHPPLLTWTLFLLVVLGIVGVVWRNKIIRSIALKGQAAMYGEWVVQ